MLPSRVPAHRAGEEGAVVALKIDLKELSVLSADSDFTEYQHLMY